MVLRKVKVVLLKYSFIHPDIEQVKFSIQHTKQQLVKVEYRYFHQKKGWSVQ
jgi:hypothetical protein